MRWETLKIEIMSSKDLVQFSNPGWEAERTDAIVRARLLCGWKTSAVCLPASYSYHHLFTNVYNIYDYFLYIFLMYRSGCGSKLFQHMLADQRADPRWDYHLFLSFEEQIRYYCKLSSILIEKALARMNPVNIMSWANSYLLSMFVHWVKNVPPGIWPSTAQASNWSRSWGSTTA